MPQAVNSVLNLYFQNEHFGIFIVLPLHRESLRQMMVKGRVGRSTKIEVLKMLLPIIVNLALDHGDIKEFLTSHSY